MNKEEIQGLLDKFKNTLENYEIDRKCGQLSVDSIYHLFPTEQQKIISCIENLQQENKELHNKIDKAIEYAEQLEHSEWVSFGRKIILEILKGDVND